MQIKQKRDIIESTAGKVFTATFIKKDGTLRKMNCRLGVTTPLKGGENTVAHIDKYVTVYDMQKKAYRNLNLETLKKVKMAGVLMDFTNPLRFC